MKDVSQKIVYDPISGSYDYEKRNCSRPHETEVYLFTMKKKDKKNFHTIHKSNQIITKEGKVK